MTSAEELRNRLPATGPRPPVTRDAVLATALTLFAERGYRVTTMGDIGAALGVRGPSLYKHVTSKQELLAEIIDRTMTTLITNQHRALDAGGPLPLQLRRAVEAHVRYHATHREQALVGNRELESLEEPTRTRILGRRRSYEHRLRALIRKGCDDGVFTTTQPKLASFSILDMGIGVATWFDAQGGYDVETLAYAYADMALRMVGAIGA